MIRSTSKHVTFGSLSQRALLFLVGAIFGVIGAEILAIDHSIPSIVIGAGAAIAGAFLAYRTLRLGVRADLRGIAHRALDGTTVIPWCRISSIAPGPAGGSSPLPTSAPVLTLDEAGRHALTGMAMYTITRRSKAAAEVRCQELRTLHALHQQSCAAC